MREFLSKWEPEDCIWLVIILGCLAMAIITSLHPKGIGG
jgi:hypothetical protein